MIMLGLRLGELYLLSAALMALAAGSAMLFSSHHHDRAGGVFRRRIAAVITWPIAVLSANGRRHLKRAWKGNIR